jgi:hypothetical protein
MLAGGLVGLSKLARWLQRIRGSPLDASRLVRARTCLNIEARGPLAQLFDITTSRDLRDPFQY